MNQVIGRQYSIPLATSFIILFLILVLGTPSPTQAWQSQAECEGHGNALELCKEVCDRDGCPPKKVKSPTDSDPQVLSPEGENIKYSRFKKKCCRPGCKWNCPEKRFKADEEQVVPGATTDQVE